MLLLKEFLFCRIILYQSRRSEALMVRKPLQASFNRTWMDENRRSAGGESEDKKDKRGGGLRSRLQRQENSHFLLTSV